MALSPDPLSPPLPRAWRPSRAWPIRVPPSSTHASTRTPSRLSGWFRSQIKAPSSRCHPPPFFEAWSVPCPQLMPCTHHDARGWKTGSPHPAKKKNTLLRLKRGPQVESGDTSPLGLVTTVGDLGGAAGGSHTESYAVSQPSRHSFFATWTPVALAAHLFPTWVHDFPRGHRLPLNAAPSPRRPSTRRGVTRERPKDQGRTPKGHAARYPGSSLEPPCHLPLLKQHTPRVESFGGIY